MSPEDHNKWQRLQKRYPGLEFVDKGTSIRFPWLRYQAHHIVTEFVDLPPIHRVRAAFCQAVSLRKVVAFGSSPDEVEHLLAKV